MLLRESRGARGRLLFFTACIALGVAAVVGVAGLAGALDEGIRLHAKELLACDVAVESQRPLGEDLERLLADIDGLRRTDVRELATLVGAADGDTSTLVELKVVGGA
jgi:predicted lysophospholipase L1 biosynthesis ABC-type transport system permease subunit